MSGVLHIFPKSPDASRFQVNLTVGSHSYAGVYDGEELEDFLLKSAALDRAQVRDVLTRLQSDGKATVSDIALGDTEAAVFGLREMPTDA